MVALYWIVRRWFAKPSKRELALAMSVAGLLDTMRRVVVYNDMEAARETFLGTDKQFNGWLDSAYPQPGDGLRAKRPAKRATNNIDHHFGEHTSPPCAACSGGCEGKCRLAAAKEFGTLMPHCCVVGGECQSPQDCGRSHL